MDVGPLTEKIDDGLRVAGSPEHAVREKAYLKSALDHYGTTMPVMTPIAKAMSREHPELDHDDLVALGVSRRFGNERGAVTVTCPRSRSLPRNGTFGRPRGILSVARSGTVPRMQIAESVFGSAAPSSLHGTVMASPAGPDVDGPVTNGLVRRARRMRQFKGD